MHYFLTEGLGDAVRRKFIDNRSISGAVKSQTNALGVGGGGRYLVFSPVTESQLAKIEQLRDTNYKRLRFMYLTQPQTLIIKLTLSEIHEVATSEFCRMLWEKAASIGKGLDRDLKDIRGKTHKGKFTSKEADSAFKPRSSRPGKASWPTLVVESGVSETIKRLRVDAKWWLLNSSGEVNIVLVFSIKEETKEILIEQWEMSRPEDPAPTRSQSENSIKFPKCISTFNITRVDPPELAAAAPATPPEIAVVVPANPSEPAAAALVDPPEIAVVAPADPPEPDVIPEGIRLGFEKVFARKPREGSSEKDLMFTPLELTNWANEIWQSGE